MNIAIIGTGNVGSVLGIRWAQNGHKVSWGSRTPESTRMQSLVKEAGGGASATTPSQAVYDAEVTVLATPYESTEILIKQLPPLSGKLVIDATNPLKADFSGLSIGTTTSAGEEIEKLIPDSTVVKAFNMTGADNMANPIYGEQKLSMLICGDNDDAKSVVRGLAEELGFDVIDCGPMISARCLEPMAMLWITLVGTMNMGTNIGFRLLYK